MKSLRTLLLGAAVLALVPATCFAQDVTIRFGAVYQVDHTNSRGAAEFKRIVEEESDGSMEVQVFYNSELGSEREMAEMTRAGGLEMVMSGLPGVGAFVPELEVMEALYTYGDLDDLVRVSEAISSELNALMEPQGFHLIGMMYQGPRNLLSSRPIRKLEDMQGLRLRIPKTPLFVALAKAWGATGTAVALSETYTSLESGVVEAVEGAAESLLTNGFFEHAKYLTETKHNFYPQPVTISMDFWNKLTDEQKAIIKDAGKRASQYQLSLFQEANANAINSLKEHGVEIIEPENLDAFGKPVLTVMDTYIKDKGERIYAIYQKMLEVANSDVD